MGICLELMTDADIQIFKEQCHFAVEISNELEYINIPIWNIKTYQT